jgi:putative oxygen-independent coproporphyrinogen III oxidase
LDPDLDRSPADAVDERGGTVSSDSLSAHCGNASMTGPDPGLPAAVAIYVHFPFCLSICPYCDFVVHGGADARGPANRIAATIDALSIEIRLRAPERPLTPLRSLYLGGGTPSLMSAAQVGRLIDDVEDGFGLTLGAEITLECNPGPSDRGDLAGFRAAGVNRLSIGAQSMVADELRQLGRRHSPHDVASTVGLARDAGFDNISLDVLYDAPGQTLESWQHTLDAALELAPEHLSLYALTLDDPDSEGLTGPTGDHLPLRTGARGWRRRALDAQDEDLAADCYALADEVLGAAGYGWYEISNWSRPGFESRHNLVYWTGDPWEAIGPGAHAFDGVLTRRWNAARLDAYLGALTQGRLPPGASETVDPATAFADAAILRLRTAAGLSATLASDPALRSGIAWGRANGLLESKAEGTVALTLAGRLLANELFVRLVAENSGAAAA